MSLRFGIIGLGKISSVHISSIKAIEGLLVSSCDIDRKKKLSLSDCRFYISSQEMLKREKLDIVSICTPNGFHFENMKEALFSGVRAIVCEKPLTLSVEECLELGELLERRRILLFPILQNRYSSIMQELKRLIVEKKIRKIYSIHLNQHWYRPDEYFVDWRSNPLLFGGVFINQCIHYIDIILWLLNNNYKNLFAIRRRQEREIIGEDSVVCSFEVGNTLCTINFSVLSKGENDIQLYLITDKGNIQLGGSCANKVIKWEVPFTKPEEVFVNPNNYGKFSGSLPLHYYIYKNVKEVLEQGKEQEITLFDALKGIRFCQEVLQGKIKDK